MAGQAQPAGYVGDVHALQALKAAVVAIHRVGAAVGEPRDPFRVVVLPVAGPEPAEAAEVRAGLREHLEENRRRGPVAGDVEVVVGADVEVAGRAAGLVGGLGGEAAEKAAVRVEDLDAIGRIGGVDDPVPVHPDVPAAGELPRVAAGRESGRGRLTALPGGPLADAPDELAAGAEHISAVIRVPRDVEVAMPVQVETVGDEVAVGVEVCRHGRRRGRRDPRRVVADSHQEVAVGVVLEHAVVVQVRDVHVVRGIHRHAGRPAEPVIGGVDGRGRNCAGHRPELSAADPEDEVAVPVELLDPVVGVVAHPDAVLGVDGQHLDVRAELTAQVAERPELGEVGILPRIEDLDVAGARPRRLEVAHRGEKLVRAKLHRAVARRPRHEVVGAAARLHRHRQAQAELVAARGEGHGQLAPAEHGPGAAEARIARRVQGVAPAGGQVLEGDRGRPARVDGRRLVGHPRVAQQDAHRLGVAHDRLGALRQRDPDTHDRGPPCGGDRLSGVFRRGERAIEDATAHRQHQRQQGPKAQVETRALHGITPR
ncbi:hypothetical protein D3C86_1081180 [compost metagenome]